MESSQAGPHAFLEVSPDLVKQQSTLTRWHMYLGTMQMIWDHPFGVGPGQFTFGFMPYFAPTMPEFNEMMVPQTPHSEYLRIVSEEGVLFFCLCIFVFVLFLWENRWSLLVLFKTHPVVTGYFVFLAVQSLFQFPLTSAFPFLTTSCILGYCFSILYQKKYVALKENITSFISFFVLIFGFALVLSDALTFWHADSAKSNKVAAFLNRNNWYASIQEIDAYLQKNKYVEAREALESELQRRPNNYLALVLEARLNGIEGKHALMCKSLEKMDGFFAGQSSQHGFLIKNCR